MSTVSSFIALAPFSIKSAARNRLRTLGAVLPILVCVAMLAGTSGSVDSMEPRAIENALKEKVGPDFVLSPGSPANSCRTLLDSLWMITLEARECRLVASAIPVVEILFTGNLSLSHLQHSESRGRRLCSLRLLGLPGNLSAGEAARLGIGGFKHLSRGSCLLSDDAAHMVHLSLDAGVPSIQLLSIDPISNRESPPVDLMVAGIVSLETEVTGVPARFRSAFPSTPYNVPTIIVSLNYLLAIVDSLGLAVPSHEAAYWQSTVSGRTTSTGARVLVFLDRSRLVHSENPRRLLSELTQLGDVLTSSNASAVLVENAVVDSVRTAHEEVSGLRREILALSTPLLALALYIGVTGTGNTFEKRKREISLLRIRGASCPTIRRLIIVESMTLGAIGSVAGLVLGWLSEPILQAWSPEIAASGEGVALKVLAHMPSVSTILVSFSLGMGIALGSGLALARMATLIDPSDMARISELRGRLPLPNKLALVPELHWKRDLLLASLGFGAIASGVLHRSLPYQGFAPGIWSMFAEMVLLTLYSLVPLAPFLIIISITDLVSNWKLSFSAVSSIAVRRASPLGHLVGKILLKKRRELARISLVVGLALGFAGLVAVSTASIELYREKVAPLVVGGDLRITGLNRSEAALLAAHLELEGAAYFQVVKVASFFSRGEFYVLDVPRYQIDGRVSPKLRKEISNLIASLDLTPNGALVSRSYPIQEDVKGKPIVAVPFAADHQGFVSLNLAGIYRVLPGLGSAWLGTRQPAVVVSPRTYQWLCETTSVAEYSHLTYEIVVRLPPTADVSGFASEVTSVLPGHVWRKGDILTLEQAEETETVTRRPLLSSVVQIETRYFLVLALLGVGIVAISVIGSEMAILSILAARGTAPQKLFRFVFLVLAVPLVLGNLSGITTGILAGYLWALHTVDPLVPVVVCPVLRRDYLLFVITADLVFFMFAVAASRWMRQCCGTTYGRHSTEYTG